jgi:hypothetical protein
MHVGGGVVSGSASGGVVVLVDYLSGHMVGASDPSRGKKDNV